MRITLLIAATNLLALLCSGQPGFMYSYDDIYHEPKDTLFYPFVDGVQVIEVDHLGAYWRGVHLADMAYPRALSASVDVPSPVSNEYFVRDSLGRIIRTFSSHRQLAFLDSVFASVPLEEETIDSPEFFSISNKSGGVDRVDYYGSIDQSDLSYGLINSRGELVHSPEYDGIYVTDRGIHLQKNFLWAWMDLELNLLTDFEYERMNTYPYEDSPVSEVTYFMKNGKYCGVGLKGINDFIATPCYDRIHADNLLLENGLLVVSKDQKFGLMNFKGEVVLPLEYISIYFANDPECSSKPCIRLEKNESVEFREPDAID